MDLILHMGAHRTASSTVQALLERQRDALAAEGVAAWTPRRTRSGLLTGVMGDPNRLSAARDRLVHRAAGRVALRRAGLTADGAERLVVSDENMLGGLRENLLLGRLYPTARQRLTRMAQAFPGAAAAVLTIRSPDAWWTSVFAFLATRGYPPPDRMRLADIAGGRRSWRAVVEDVAAALPDVRLRVLVYEAGGPRLLWSELTGRPADALAIPQRHAAPRVDVLERRLRAEGWTGTLDHAAGRFAPFDPDMRAEMRQAYEADLAWLRGGADGVAELAAPVPAAGARTDRPGTSRPGRERKGWIHARRSEERSALGLEGPR